MANAYVHQFCFVNLHFRRISVSLGFYLCHYYDDNKYLLYVVVCCFENCNDYREIVLKFHPAKQ